MKKSVSYIVGIVLLALCMHTAMVSASEFTVNDLVVKHPWVRATTANATVSAAYLSVENHGKQADVLINASSSVADKVELHTHIMDGDMMKMRQIESVEIGSHSSAEFEPRGNHLMLIGLKSALKTGDTIPFVLTFEKAGELKINAVVKSIVAGSEKGNKQSKQHDMKHMH